MKCEVTGKKRTNLRTIRSFFTCDVAPFIYIHVTAQTFSKVNHSSCLLCVRSPAARTNKQMMCIF